LKVLESLFWKLRVVLYAYIDFCEFTGHAFGDGVCHSVDYGCLSMAKLFWMGALQLVWLKIEAKVTMYVQRFMEKHCAQHTLNIQII